MKRWMQIAVVGFTLGALVPPLVGQDGRFDAPVEYRPQELLYAMNVPATATARAELRELVGAQANEVLWPGAIFKMILPEDVDLFGAIATLRSDPRIAFAEPNGIVRALEIPDDPDYGLQWGWSMISAPSAWDVHIDASDALVAVIDTGIQYDHPDLEANVWVNVGEIPDNGLDDDGNGFVDDVHGYDFVNDDGDPWDDHGHGTHCSGTVGAVTNNATGVAGTCWLAQIAAIKFLDDAATGSWDDAVQAVNYAVTIGAQVTSNSWGGYDGSAALELAIELAGDAGQLFVAAAGNDSLDNDEDFAYPASYDCDCIIAVAATDSADELAGFSNYGLETVDLGAPGVDIYSTLPGSSYTYASGTSMACPHVAGVATMLFAAEETATWTVVKNWILDSVDVTPAMTGRCTTDGRLNMAQAIELIESPTLTTSGSGLLISVQAPVPLQKLHVDPGDLVHFEPRTGTYHMVFDGEDVVGSTQQLDAAALLPDGSLLLSYADDGIELPGAGTVDDEDVVRFIPFQWGEHTEGLFRRYFDGSDVGLDTAGEDVSACSIDANGNLQFSTKGAFDIDGRLTGKNEDVLEFVADRLGSETSGRLRKIFHGRSPEVRLGGSGEQIDGYHYDTRSGDLWMTTAGSFRVPVNLRGHDDDILLFRPTSLGEPTEGRFHVVFRGLPNNVELHNIDALVVLD